MILCALSHFVFKGLCLVVFIVIVAASDTIMIMIMIIIIITSSTWKAIGGTIQVMGLPAGSCACDCWRESPSGSVTSGVQPLARGSLSSQPRRPPPRGFQMQLRGKVIS